MLLWLVGITDSKEWRDGKDAILTYGSNSVEIEAAATEIYFSMSSNSGDGMLAVVA